MLEIAFIKKTRKVFVREVKVGAKWFDYGIKLSHEIAASHDLIRKSLDFRDKILKGCNIGIIENKDVIKCGVTSKSLIEFYLDGDTTVI